MAYDQGTETDPEVTLQLMNRDSKITIINLLMDLKKSVNIEKWKINKQEILGIKNKFVFVEKFIRWAYQNIKHCRWKHL